MYLNREVGCLLRTIAQTHGSYHVALGRDAHTCTAAHSALSLYLLPQVILCALHLVALRVGLYLGHYLVYLLKLHVHNVVHYALSQGYMLAEQFIIEICLVCERINHIRIKVDRQQTA